VLAALEDDLWTGFKQQSASDKTIGPNEEEERTVLPQTLTEEKTIKYY